MIAWALRSVAAQEAASTTERGSRVRRGRRTGWMSPSPRWSDERTTTPSRGRTRTPRGISRKMAGAAIPRSPSSEAALSPASAAPGACASNSPGRSLPPASFNHPTRVTLTKDGAGIASRENHRRVVGCHAGTVIGGAPPGNCTAPQGGRLGRPETVDSARSRAMLLH
jgi:hypothetical protein